LTALLIAEAMNLLDTTIVAVAAPVVHTDLGGPVSDVPWFGAAYTLPFALLLITGGRLGDIAGQRVSRVGVAGFALGSLACALAPSAGLLIAARVVQGAAAAAVIPQTIGLVKAMFDGPALSRALGCIGPVMTLAAVCGPVVSGVLTQADVFGWSWRAVFLVNLPPAALVLLLAARLPEDRAVGRPRLDLPGTLLVALGTGLIVYPLIDTGASGPAPGWLTGGAGAAALTAFAVQRRGVARRGGSPLVELSLFADRRFPCALVASTLFFAVQSGLALDVVLHLQLGRGAGSLDARAAGLSLLPWSVATGLASWLAGSRLVPRYGARVMPVGLGVGVTGVLAAAGLALTGPGGPVWPLPAAMGVAGLGCGLFTSAFFSTAVHRVRPAETGSAAGLLNAVQQLTPREWQGLP
jgi:MFS family permease